MSTECLTGHLQPLVVSGAGWDSEGVTDGGEMRSVVYVVQRGRMSQQEQMSCDGTW